MPGHLRPYQSASTRLTKSQQQYYEVSARIIQLMNEYSAYTDAETFWLAMKKSGLQLSLSTFYNRLRFLVDNGIVEKQTVKYNKNLYRVKSDTNINRIP
ncbi:transcriptional repressor [Mucilaginibacter agri]|uniref:Ferric uptake regulator family protein n=1 Tax=Mucilaginibacter agri TaxID=2695265 RepID=A0A966DWH8_9SPHI|nr:transcriptional repressor [Mucilaginibacter agri]NCD72551.1 hypothetical protein [Mucilaginibacter agri]